MGRKRGGSSHAKGQICRTISCPDDIDSCKRANGIVANRFEDEHLVGPYYQAIEELPTQERVLLFAMAIRGEDPSISSHLPTTLAELAALVPTGDPALDTAAKSVLFHRVEDTLRTGSRPRYGRALMCRFYRRAMPSVLEFLRQTVVGWQDAKHAAGGCSPGAIYSGLIGWFVGLLDGLAGFSIEDLGFPPYRGGLLFEEELMSEIRRRYDPEFKSGAVRIVLETGKPIARVVRDLGLQCGYVGELGEAAACFPGGQRAVG